MEIKVYNAGSQPTPAYQTDGAAAFDLYANSLKLNEDYGVIEYGTGLRFEIPEGYYGKIVPRSSIYKKELILCNHSGVVDSDYRGEVRVIFRHVRSRGHVVEAASALENNGPSFYKYWLENNFYPGVYKIGDRIAQMMILPVEQVNIVEVDSGFLLGKTARGENGFGSTG